MADLLEKCCIDTEELKEYLKNNNYYRLLICTTDELEHNLCSYKYFRNQLVEYYKQRGIYVDGPQHLHLKDGELYVWIIDLFILKVIK